jgi:hypothetical protein
MVSSAEPDRTICDCPFGAGGPEHEPAQRGEQASPHVWSLGGGRAMEQPGEHGQHGQHLDDEDLLLEHRGPGRQLADPVGDEERSERGGARPQRGVCQALGQADDRHQDEQPGGVAQGARLERLQPQGQPQAQDHRGRDGIAQDA